MNDFLFSSPLFVWFTECKKCYKPCPCVLINFKTNMLHMAPVTNGFDLWVHEINSLYWVLAESGGRTHAWPLEKTHGKVLDVVTWIFFVFGSGSLDAEDCVMAYPITLSMGPVLCMLVPKSPQVSVGLSELFRNTFS